MSTTEEKYIISVSTRGVDKSRRAMEGTGNAALRSAGKIKKMAGSMALLGSTALAANLLRMSDDFTQLRIRVGLVTQGTAELNSVLRELRHVSNDTRSDIRTNVEVFARMSLAVRGLGFSQADAIKATKALNAAMQISGASADETSASIIQFTQGLAANRLAGDEMRSVLEQTPKVMDVILDALNSVPGAVKRARGDVRAMAEAGFFTAPVLMKALTGQSADDIIEEFANTRKTLRQQYVVMRNEFIMEAGKFMDIMGPSAGIGKAFELVTKNMEGLVRLLSGGALLASLAAFGSAAAAALTPLGVKIGLLLTLASRLDKVLVAKGQNGNNVFAIDIVGGAMEAMASRMERTGQRFMDKIDQFLSQDTNRSMAGLVTWMKGTAQVILDLLQDLASWLHFTVGLIKDGILSMVRTVGNVMGAVGDMLLRVDPDILGSFAKPVQRLGTALKEPGDTASNMVKNFSSFLGSRLTDSMSRRGRMLEALAAVGLDRDFEAAQTAVKGLFINLKQNLFSFIDEVSDASTSQAAARQKRNDHLTQFLSGSRQAVHDMLSDKTAFPAGGAGEGALPGQFLIAQVMDKLKQDRDVLIKFNAIEIEQYKEMVKVATKLNKVTVTDAQTAELQRLVDEMLLAQRAATIRERFMQSEAQANRDAAALLRRDNIITGGQFDRVVSETEIQRLSQSMDMVSGFKRGFEQVKLSTMDVASTAENALVNAFQSAEDAMVNFVKTGKLEFRSLATSIIADLARIAIRQNLMPLLQQGLTAATGAALNGFGLGSRSLGGVQADVPAQQNINFNIQTPDPGGFRHQVPGILATANASRTA